MSDRLSSRTYIWTECRANWCEEEDFLQLFSQKSWSRSFWRYVTSCFGLLTPEKQSWVIGRGLCGWSIWQIDRSSSLVRVSLLNWQCRGSPYSSSFQYGLGLMWSKEHFLHIMCEGGCSAQVCIGRLLLLLLFNSQLCSQFDCDFQSVAITDQEQLTNLCKSCAFPADFLQWNFVILFQTVGIECSHFLLIHVHV